MIHAKEIGFPAWCSGGNSFYSNEGLKTLFSSLVGPLVETLVGEKKNVNDLQFKDIKNINCAVTSFDLNINSVVYFTNFTDECQNMYILDAILATSAAPTYFPIHTFNCEYKDPRRGNRVDQYQCIDGGVWANDPGMFAFAFESILHPAKVYNIISFGTGLHQCNYILRQGHEDLLSWITYQPNIIDTFFNASTSQVDKLFEHTGKTGYIRHTKLNITLDKPVDLADADSIPTLVDYFNNRETSEITDPTNMTRFPDNMTEAIRQTWQMGTNESPHIINHFRINTRGKNRIPIDKIKGVGEAKIEPTSFQRGVSWVADKGKSVAGWVAVNGKSGAGWVADNGKSVAGWVGDGVGWVADNGKSGAGWVVNKGKSLFGYFKSKSQIQQEIPTEELIGDEYLPNPKTNPLNYQNHHKVE